jgi:hypothetical protein
MDVGFCNNKIASKGPIMVTKLDATSRYQNLLLFRLNTQYHIIKIALLPFMNGKPYHKGDQQA